MESLYFIAIIPPEDLEKEIETIKKYLFQNYKTKASLRSPAHITLHMPFKWKNFKIQLLHKNLQDFFKGKEKFNVNLNGFRAFPPRVIFIDVEENTKLYDFQKQLIKFSKVNLKVFNGNYKEDIFHPHVTVAFRDLRKHFFFQAFEEFKNKEFKKSFLVDHVTLLKHNGKIWIVDKEFYL